MTGLSISKLRVGAEAYQLSGVAESLGDYYTGAGEATGRWVGAATPALGLSGDVEPDDLRAVLAGLAPGGGGLTPNGTSPVVHPRRVPGFDLTFKVPKSVSVLYAVSDDPRVQGAIIDAGNTAVDHVIGWLERETVRVRRGSNSILHLGKTEAESGVRDAIREIETSGLIAASFRHRTSRAGDPFLHWHVLAANMAQGVDGKWSSIVHPHLYSHARAAGEMFQAVVRNELTTSLGVEWRPGRHVSEIAGVPDEIMRVFSKRRAEIDAYTRATGTPADGAGNQAAALATRRSKGEQETTVGLTQRWRTEAIESGWGPVEADTLLGTGRPRGTVDYDDGVWRLPTVWFDQNGTAHHSDRSVDAEDWISDVLRRDLTNERSTFRPADAVHAVAARLGQGATVDTIERVTNRLFASDQVLPVGDAFTSRELHDVETKLIDAFDLDAELVGPDRGVVGRVLELCPTLGPDQAAAVRETAAAAGSVSVMIGPAGTGKTYTLNTIRRVFETAGWNVTGAAPSARAAAELGSGAGIEASTMHSLLGRVDRGMHRFGAADLVVIDEAGMADTRTLQRLVSAAVDNGARVLLVGDHRQLPEVGAGGGFAYATQHAGTVTELTINRRQKQPWEQDALIQLRDGNIADAVDAYLQHGRVVTTPDSLSLIDTAITAWTNAQARGIDAVLVAGSNEMVDRLNTAALDQLTRPGQPLHTAETGTFGGHEWRVGQRAVIRRNYTTPDGSVRVRNGQAGTITALTAQTLTIRLDDTLQPVTLDQRFVAAGGRLAHGYASTIHRTQGGTWDAAITVGLDGLYREGAYTALSRGRTSNVILLTHPETRQLENERAQDPQRHDGGLRLPTEEPGTPRTELTDRINQRRGKHLAHTLDPDAAVIDRHATTHPYPVLVDRAARAAQIERVATAAVGSTVDALADRAARAEHTATHLGPGVRVKVLDRHNIGTILTSNDHNATARVRFESVDGREATRTMPWDGLAVIEPDTPTRSLTPAARAWLDGLSSELDDAISNWNHTVRTLGSIPGDAHRYHQAADLHLTRAVNHLAAEQPEWLNNLIGPRPVHPEGNTTWRSTLTDITAFRLTNNIPDTVPGLGDPTTANKNEWLGLQRRIGDTRHWLHQHPDHAAIQWPIHPSPGGLLRRQREVDAILATAPPDQRHTINQILTGQLALGDTQQLLDTATTGQTERQQWIITNWPHIIEATHITTALDTGTFGPDIGVLSREIGRSTGSRSLYTDAEARAPWLAAALNHTSHPGDAHITTRALNWLEQVADYRHEHRITSRDPLGPLPHNLEQQTIWHALEERSSTLHQPECVRAQPSFLEQPNDNLLHQLNRPERPHRNHPDADIDIER